MVSVLGSTEPARKSKIYASLALRLTYHSEQKKVLVTQASARNAIGDRFVSEGRAHPKANAC